MKGIIFAGGNTTKLHPLTKVISKQLLPIHDKPMIYYSMSILMQAGIKEILIIAKKVDIPNYINLLGHGSNFGLQIFYEEAEEHCSLAESFIIGENFIGTDNVVLISGNSLFHGSELIQLIKQFETSNKGAKMLAYRSKNSKRTETIDFYKAEDIISFYEESKNKKSSYTIAGLYFFDNSVIEISKAIKFKISDPLEISSIYKEYLNRNSLNVKLIGNDSYCFEIETPESLLVATNFIRTMENLKNFKIGCLEEIAYDMGYIDKKELLLLAEPLLKSTYGQYLINLIEKELESIV